MSNPGQDTLQLILASQSASRRAMLGAAGVPFVAQAPMVDEDAAKAALGNVAPRDLADSLAELKALKVSQRAPQALVLGSDSLAVLEDGTILSKPRDREEAAAHLAMMSGKRHDLVSAAVIAEGGRAVWRHVDKARMIVRPLSLAFIEAYLDAEWPAIAGCVGCYRIEGPGVQLFSRVEGSQFTVLGMPLLPLLGYLRERQVLLA
ncbi:Maf-like protein [Sphingomonas sp. NBWT7]|nr:Maf-like protein [Sphingomonas sp. NBWT7]